jgi:hypothetical protein
MILSERGREIFKACLNRHIGTAGVFKKQEAGHQAEILKSSLRLKGGPRENETDLGGGSTLGGCS